MGRSRLRDDPLAATPRFVGGCAAIQHHRALFRLELIAGKSRGDQFQAWRGSAPQTVLLMGLSLAAAAFSQPWILGVGS